MDIELCKSCKDFSIQALLLAAAAAPTLPGKRGQPAIHQSVPRFFKQHSNLQRLKHAAELCDLCSRIWSQYSRQLKADQLTEDALSKDSRNGPIFIGTEIFNTSLNPTPQVVVIQDSVSPQRSQRQLAVFEVCYKYDEKPKLHNHLLARLQASNSADAQCFEFAREWLTNCRQNHAQCKRAYSPNTRWPTRVIDVYPDPDGATRNADTAQLVDGEACEGLYTALSYVWGGEKDLILTLNSEDSLRRGKPLTEFPATLRDAITVTRELGLRYVWIDALCIFQDQERQEARDDWAREAGKMRDVYSGATVTIEAASASKASEGFLKGRISSKPYCRLPWGSQRDEPFVYLRPFLDITDSQLLGTKIYSRGWTLQERLLAPRTLSYGTQQISFECVHGFVDEAGRLLALPSRTESYLSKDFMNELRNDISDKSTGTKIFERFHSSVAVPWYSKFGRGDHHSNHERDGYWSTYQKQWRAIAQRFSERQLTNSSDRLVAVSGLADEFQRATGDDYVAGVWKKGLLYNLAWDCGPLYNRSGKYGTYPGYVPPSNFVQDYPDGIKSGSYVAPSWSWSSVQGRITFFGFRFDPNSRPEITLHATVKEVSTSPKYTTDTLGSLNDGHLVLSAPYIPIPDPQVPCSQDFQMRNLHDRIRTDAIQISDDFASEYHQHHEAHDGQEFGLLKLLDFVAPHDLAGKQLMMLLVESCATGGFRRLCRFEQTMASLRELEDETTRDMKVVSESDRERIANTRPYLKNIATQASEILSADWIQRDITLV